MKRYVRSVTLPLLFLPIMLLCVSDSALHGAEQSSSNYSMASNVLSGGGGEYGTANYELQYTLGQPSPIGVFSSSNYDDNAGFWFLGDWFPDSDGDGIPDETDAFPDDPNEWLDTDGDGTGNNADTDDDGDGMPDEWEIRYGLDPLFDDADEDPDNDGYKNIQEYLERGDPYDPGEPFPWELFYPAFMKKRN